VICSDIGGMSKRVTDTVNGMHFKRRDAEDLARKMQRAAETPALWDEFRKNIPPAPPRLMDDHARILVDAYNELLRNGSDRAAASAPPKEVARA
jgi:glycosyltransferase involved in cell wall biosynthesis